MHSTLGLAMRRPTLCHGSAPHVSLAQWCSLASEAYDTGAQQTPSPAAVDTKAGFLELVRRGHSATALDVSPAARLLNCSLGLDDFVRRWNKLNEALETCYYTRLSLSGHYAIRIEHYARWEANTPRWTLAFVAGVIAGTLERMGGEVPIQSLLSQQNGAMDDALPACSKPLWLELARRPEHAPLDMTRLPTCSESIRHILQLILAEPAEDWTLQRAAQTLALSSRTLQRRFQEHGSSFQQLLKAARLQRALAALQDGNNSLTAISHACGFADSAHFSRLFNAAAGMPPRSFRAMAGYRSH